MQVSIKRAYDKPASSDGYRILVDRVWPRGVKKEDLKLDEWCRDVAPSTELRKWFNHEPNKFNEFQKKYQKELDNSKIAQELIYNLAKKSQVTLVYSAKDEQHNQAVVLKDYLEKHT